MRLGPLEFTPSLIPTVAAVCLAVLFVGLGFWQLDRARTKDDLLDDYRHRAGGPVADVSSLDAGDPEALRYRRAAASGVFEPGRQFLLDNRTDGGTAGYHVLTPLRLAGGAGGLVVNRGWVPVGPRRSEPPDAPAPEGARTVTGTVYLPPRGQVLLGPDGYETGGWPMVVQRVDLGAMAERLGYPLLPYVLRLGEGEPDGFLRRWEPRLGMGPDRHRGYAFQWFALAATLVAIYGYLTLSRHRAPRR